MCKRSMYRGVKMCVGCTVGCMCERFVCTYFVILTCGQQFGMFVFIVNRTTLCPILVRVCLHACVSVCACVCLNIRLDKRSQWSKLSLDHWFISLSLYKLVSKFDIVSSITTDHCGIQLQFRELKENYDFGTSYWKFNNSLFNEKKKCG